MTSQSLSRQSFQRLHRLHAVSGGLQINLGFRPELEGRYLLNPIALIQVKNLIDFIDDSCYRFLKHHWHINILSKKNSRQNGGIHEHKSVLFPLPNHP